MAGRPRSFDAEIALEKIMEAFWDRGFAGTSIDELLDRIGVKRGSFYAAFGDKENAWRLALARYTETVTAAGFSILESADAPEEKIGSFIRFAGRLLADNCGRGCMFLSAASEALPASPATQAHFARLESRLFATIRRKAPEPVGSYVIALLLGMNAMARGGMRAESILAAAEIGSKTAGSMLATRAY